MSFGRNLSDPNDAGPPNCILFGHPLELFYRVGGIFDFDFTDAKILEIVNSGKGIDKELYPDTSNRTFNVEASYGGIEKDADGKIISASAIAYSYLLDETGRFANTFDGGLKANLLDFCYRRRLLAADPYVYTKRYDKWRKLVAQVEAGESGGGEMAPLVSMRK